MEEVWNRKSSNKERSKCTCQVTGKVTSTEIGNENYNVYENNVSEASCSKHPQVSNIDRSVHCSGGKARSSIQTPAPQVLDKSLLAPGAPRVLLENQLTNSDSHDITNFDTFNYQQYLRTPPSIKSQRLYFKGNSPQFQYRGYDRFDRVSDEIILRIFHFLPRHLMCTCALVCRRWARIVCDISLWRQMDMGSRLVRKGVLKIILERGVEILRLNCSEIKGDFSSTVVGVPDPRRSPLSEDRLYRLQYLDMSMANVETSLVESLLKFCPNLQKISLENIPVTEQLLVNLSLNSPYLDTLNLCMSGGVTARGLCYIFQNCTSLSELNIAWTGMSSSDLFSVTQSLPPQILALNISGCRERMTDDCVVNLSKRCINLQDLDLSDATHISNVALDAVVMYLTQLQMISISRCYKVTPGHIVNLKKLPELERVNIFGIMRDVTLEMMEQHLSKFKVNRYPFSAIARPTVNNRNVRIWNQVSAA